MDKSNKGRTNLRHYPFGHNALQGTRVSGVYAARQSPEPRERLLRRSSCLAKTYNCAVFKQFVH